MIINKTQRSDNETVLRLNYPTFERIRQLEKDSSLPEIEFMQNLWRIRARETQSYHLEGSGKADFSTTRDAFFSREILTNSRNKHTRFFRSSNFTALSSEKFFRARVLFTFFSIDDFSVFKDSEIENAFVIILSFLISKLTYGAYHPCPLLKAPTIYFPVLFWRKDVYYVRSFHWVRLMAENKTEARDLTSHLKFRPSSSLTRSSFHRDKSFPSLLLFFSFISSSPSQVVNLPIPYPSIPYSFIRRTLLAPHYTRTLRGLWTLQYCCSYWRTRLSTRLFTYIGRPPVKDSLPKLEI